MWRGVMLVAACLLLAAAPTSSGAPSAGALSGLLAAAASPSIAAYERLLRYNASLPLPLLRNGLVHSGSNARVRRVLAKLLAGEPTHLGLLGSGASRALGGGDGWLAAVGAALRAAFPGSTLTTRSSALPGGQSELAAACLEQLLHRRVDVVFVEFTAADGFSDGSVNNAPTQAFERLLRRLLRLPSRPAVVVINLLQPGSADSSSGGGGAGGSARLQPPGEQQQHAAQPGAAPRPSRRFYETAEDHIGVVAQFYDVPTLSLRNAVWHGLARGEAGFRLADLFARPDSGRHHHRQQQQQHGNASSRAGGRLPGASPPAGRGGGARRQHASGGGAAAHERPPAAAAHAGTWVLSARGQRLVADLVVGFLQQALAESLLLPLSPRDIAAARRLPAPLLPGNHGSRGSGCAAGLDLYAAAVEPLAGWRFEAQEAAGAKPQHWAFVPRAPGATLVLQLDTRASGAAAPVPLLGLVRKVQLLQEAGQAAAAGELLSSAAADAGAGPADDWAAWWWDAPTGDERGGTGDAAAAAALAQLRRSRAQRPYDANGERLVGANGGGGLEQPPPLHAFAAAKMVTSTGVEVLSLDRPPATVGTRTRSGVEVLPNTPPPSPAATAASAAGRRLAAAAAAGAVPPPAAGSAGAQAFALLQPRPMLLWLAYGHGHGSRVRVLCLSGCVCDEALLEPVAAPPPHAGRAGRAGQRHALARLHVSESADCRVGVQALGNSSAAPGFKLTGVLLSRDVPYPAGDGHSAAAAVHAALLGAEAADEAAE